MKVLAAVVLVGGGVVKYLVPGRRLKDAGVPASTLWLGGLLGVVGFFVVPVLGLFLFFVGGLYLAELARLGSAAAAWPSTRTALGAVGLVVLVELTSSLLAAGTWLLAVLLPWLAR